MAGNPLRGEATLDAGARGELTIVFDVNALCCAEERLGKTTDEIVVMVSEEFSDWARAAAGEDVTPRVNANLTRLLLWAGLQKHYPETHMFEAGEIMSEAGVGPSAIAVLNAFFAAFGTAEGEEGARPPHKPGKGARGAG